MKKNNILRALGLIISIGTLLVVLTIPIIFVEKKNIDSKKTKFDISKIIKNPITPVGDAAEIKYLGTWGNLTWTIDSEGLLTISGEGEMDDYSSSDSHWRSYKSYINKAVIEDEVTSIGDNAFNGCSNLTSVDLGKKVASIGEYAFKLCSSLTSITIPEKVTSIGNYAFEFCSNLTSVDIGENVTTIGNYAFSDCSGLTSITIPEKVCNIGEAAFINCKSLEEIQYNAKAVADLTYESNVFANAGIDGNGITVIFGNTVEKIPTCLFQYDFYSFDKEPKIISVIISENVTSIGAHAFYDCSSLTNVVIGENVTSIGNGAFEHCVSLKEIQYNAKAVADLNSNSDVFYNSRHKSDTNVIFGDMVEKIPAYLFESSSITRVVIGKNVTNIGEFAFSDCMYLKEIQYNARAVEDLTNRSYVFANSGTEEKNIVVTFGDTVKKIPAYLFYGYDRIMNITSVAIGENITSIGRDAFGYCSKLTNITIPEQITSIGTFAFGGCNNLKEIQYNAIAVEDLDQNSVVFQNTGIDTDGISITIGKNVKKIPDYLFNYGKLKKVTFLNDAPIVGSHAFNSQTVEAYYPYDNSTWTSNIRIYRYGNGYFTWNAYSNEKIKSASGTISKNSYVVGEELDKSGISVVLTYPSGLSETYDYSSGYITTGDYDMSKKGSYLIKVNGTNIVGKTFESEIEIFIHDLEEKTMDKSKYPESSHNYESSLNKEYVYSVPDALSLKVKFSELTSVEKNVDYIYVNGTRYTGTTLAGQTLNIQGNQLTIRLVTDSRDNEYGFSIDNIDATFIVHEYVVEKIVNPTCTEQGYTVYKCPCGTTKFDDYISAKGHKLTKTEEKAATYYEDGNIAYWTCDVCKKYYKDEQGTKEIEKNSWIIPKEKDKIYWGYNEISKVLYIAPYLTEEMKACENAKGSFGENEVYQSSITLPWHNYRDEITKIVFQEKVAPKSVREWFHALKKLETIENINNLDTSKVTDMSDMFNSCVNLKKLNLSSFSTAQVTDMSGMFSGCYILEELNLSSFNTSQVTDMTRMFSNCQRLAELDLSSFDMTKVSSASNMFYENLQQIHTPKNVKIDIELPAAISPDGVILQSLWYDYQNNAYSYLPKSIQSYFLIRTVTPCTITLDANGGSGSMQALEALYNEDTGSYEVDLPDNTFTAPMNRCTFIGWSVNIVGDVLTTSKFRTLGYTTLYAQWDVHKMSHYSAKVATCTEVGNYEYWKCSKCNKVFKDNGCTEEYSTNSWIIPATGHRMAHYPAKAATTTSEGNTEYWYCSSCNKYFSDSAGTHEIAAYSWVIPKIPTPTTTVNISNSYIESATGTSSNLSASVSPAGSTQSITWTSSDPSIASVNQYGTVQMNRYGRVTITATSAYGTSASCTVQTRYWDVNSPCYWYDPVYWAADNNITKGYDNVYFGPEENCKRKDMMIFLWRIAGCPQVSGTLPFKDMKSYATTSDSYKAVLWGYKSGITKGFSDGGFHPTASVNRKDTMIMIYRLAGKPSVSGPLYFKDVVGKYAPSTDTYKAIQWGYQKGITKGYSDGTFGNFINCYRKDIATFLYRWKSK